MEDQFKSLFASRTFWGAMISILATIAGMAGYTISPEDQQQIILAVSSGAAIVGSIIAIVGRVLATKAIGKPPVT